ncbi:hypothetical protein HY385_02670 [Candidatus Daviesbacteria bacterium]|nr:hypothetical protein [Candidatus Daviesbacteria bacterium]
MNWTKFLSVLVFGIFFGLVEAAIVIYLRSFFDLQSIHPLTDLTKQDIAISFKAIAFLKPHLSVLIMGSQKILMVELWRELATLVMLVSLAIAVGENFRQRLAYFFLSFGMWDIFYYIFLKFFLNWPNTLFDTDVFFLIPVAWIGPVLTPLIISSLLIITSVFILEKRK